MRGAIGQAALGAVQHDPRDLADPGPGAGFVDRLGVAVAGIGELALIALAGALIDHAADACWESCCCRPGSGSPRPPRTGL